MEREDIKLSLLLIAGDLILYIGSPNGNSEPSEKEIKKTSPLII
jgi:hypothetical protein